MTTQNHLVVTKIMNVMEERRKNNYRKKILENAWDNEEKVIHSSSSLFVQNWSADVITVVLIFCLLSLFNKSLSKQCIF